MIKAHTFILKILYPYRFQQLGLFISVLLISFSANLKPYIIKLFIDDTFKNQINLTYIISLYILSDLIRTTGWLLNNYLGFFLHPRISTDAISYFNNKINTYKYSFFQDTQTGAITSKLNDIFTLLPNLLNTIYNNFISLGTTLILTLYLLYQTHFIFTIYLFILCVSCILLIIIGNQKVFPITKQYAEYKSKLWGYISDFLSNFLNVRIFSNEKHENDQHKCHNKNFIKFANIQHKFLIKFYTSFDFLYGSYMIGCIYLLTYLQKARQISVGDIALILTLNLHIIEQLYGTVYKDG